MNLMSILLKALLSDGALKALTKRTGVNSKQLKKLLPLAVPLLLRALTKNASSKDGAASLLGALSQHTSTKSMAEQIDEADETDGGKIIGHILGGGQQADILALSQQSGLSETEVSGVLSGIAPALLSGLSAATGGGKPGKVDLSDGLDLGDVMAMLGGGQSQGGLLGGLLGKKPKEESDAAVNGAALLQSLLSLK